MPRLIKSGNRYVWTGGYHDRQIPKEAKFRYDPNAKCWYTKYPRIAIKLIEYADTSCRKQLEEFKDALELNLEASSAYSMKLDPIFIKSLREATPDEITLYPYQEIGIWWLTTRYSVLLADEMGLGKCCECLISLNILKDVKSVLLIVQKSIKANWKLEWEKFSTRSDLTLEIWNDKRKSTQIESDVVIINYDIVKKFRHLLDIEWDLIIIDECHYLKNREAQRTKHIYGFDDYKGRKKGKDKSIEPLRATRKWNLTGTPLPNRPVELWTTLHWLNKKEWSWFMTYAKRYCDAFQGPWGWDFSGASNLDELHERIRADLMLRRLKKDVLKELPPKIRQVIEIDPTGIKKTLKLQKELWEQMREGSPGMDDIAEMARLRHEVALAKVPYTVEHIANMLESGIEKIVVFTHHRDAMDQIAESFPNQHVIVRGDTPADERQNLVDRFWGEPETKLFFGGLKSASVGLNLHCNGKCSHAVFVEGDFVPSTISQAEDRLHRVGQSAESVLIQHLVFEDSLDACLANMCVEKQKVIDQVLDGGTIDLDIQEKQKDQPGAHREETEENTDQMSDDQIEAVHECLRLLDISESFELGEKKFGQALASTVFLTLPQAEAGLQIIVKYHKQLPDGLLKKAKGEDD